EEAQEQPEIGHRQDDPQDRVQPAYHLPSAEQRAERVETGVEQGQAAQQKKHECARHDPVVDAGAAGVARHADVRCGIGIAHLPPPARRSALSSSSSVTRFGPRNRWWMTPAAAVSPIRARPAYLLIPFHAWTSGLMRGLSGSPA